MPLVSIVHHICCHDLLAFVTKSNHDFDKKGHNLRTIFNFKAPPYTTSCITRINKCSICTCLYTSVLMHILWLGKQIRHDVYRNTHYLQAVSMCRHAAPTWVVSCFSKAHCPYCQHIWYFVSDFLCFFLNSWIYLKNEDAHRWELKLLSATAVMSW